MRPEGNSSAAISLRDGSGRTAQKLDDKPVAQNDPGRQPDKKDKEKGKEIEAAIPSITPRLFFPFFVSFVLFVVLLIGACPRGSAAA